mmetsp:Transcript_37718/g.39187  ORF Transcript_37718/g.39187 Transcript_37718/m.39187 type:complete len:270 (+) Transcript_37718:9-818(+)
MCIKKSEYIKENSESYINFKDNDFCECVEKHSFVKTLKSVIDEKSLGNKFSLCDIGCGEGKYIRSFSQLTQGKIIGIDLSDAMISKAKESKDFQGSNTEFFVGDCLEENEKIPEMLNYEKFDVVTACFVLNYCTTKEVLKNALTFVKKNLLKEDGVFIAMVTNLYGKLCPPELYQHMGIAHLDANMKIKNNYISGENVKLVLFEPGNFNINGPFSMILNSYQYDYDTMNNTLLSGGFKEMKVLSMEETEETKGKFSEKLVKMNQIIIAN